MVDGRIHGAPRWHSTDQSITNVIAVRTKYARDNCWLPYTSSSSSPFPFYSRARHCCPLLVRIMPIRRLYIFINNKLHSYLWLRAETREAKREREWANERVRAYIVVIVIVHCRFGGHHTSQKKITQIMYDKNLPYVRVLPSLANNNRRFSIHTLFSTLFVRPFIFFFFCIFRSIFVFRVISCDCVCVWPFTSMSHSPLVFRVATTERWRERKHIFHEKIRRRANGQFFVHFDVEHIASDGTWHEGHEVKVKKVLLHIYVRYNKTTTAATRTATPPPPSPSPPLPPPPKPLKSNRKKRLENIARRKVCGESSERMESELNCVCSGRLRIDKMNCKTW